MRQLVGTLDEPPEHVVAFYREPGRSLRDNPARRYAEVDAAMRAPVVVAAEVLSQDRLEVAPPEHQGPVEAGRVVLFCDVLRPLRLLAEDEDVLLAWDPRYWLGGGGGSGALGPV